MWSRWLIAPSLLIACTPAKSPPPTTPAPEDAPVVGIPVTVEEPAVEQPNIDEPAVGAETAMHQTESGITWTVLRTGSGDTHPMQNDTVEVHYEGWTTNGARFDSSVERGRPARFGVSKVIAGWTEVLQLMVVGDKWRVTIPADLAYGHVPKRPGAPAGDLIFEIDLLDITVAPAVPVDVAAPPANAIVTASGLAFRVLRKGSGGQHPTPADRVKVHYSGWTTDGKLFDSSVTRGKPATVVVKGMIKGWTEALQLMSPGDLMRVWVPANLAYGNPPKRVGAPAGMLVFDIELIAIIP